jgi:glycosyltransferase involved in cell wall biosynthesis
VNILLSNISLFEVGGSETWVRTMYDYLSRDHTVHVFTFNHRIWPDIRKYNRNVQYDLAILNHHQTLTHLLPHGNIKRIITTSHGVIPEPEQPRAGADVYCGVSEEVVEMLAVKGFPKARVMRNPISLERFRATRHVKDELTNVLFLSNHQGYALPVIEEACEGLNLVVYGQTNKRLDTEVLMNEVDLVIGLGRVVYEAMACERNVIVYDYLGADGFVTPDAMMGYRTHNCSGRYAKRSFTAESLREEMELYDPMLGPKLRAYVEENNNVAKIAEEYLTL